MNWQPIETAPKDGTWVLIWDHGWLLARADTFMNGFGWADQMNAYRNPTHWMPLPKPPANRNLQTAVQTANHTP